MNDLKVNDLITLERCKKTFLSERKSTETYCVINITSDIVTLANPSKIGLFANVDINNMFDYHDPQKGELKNIKVKSFKIDMDTWKLREDNVKIYTIENPETNEVRYKIV